MNSKGSEDEANVFEKSHSNWPAVPNCERRQRLNFSLKSTTKPIRVKAFAQNINSYQTCKTPPTFTPFGLS